MTDGGVNRVSRALLTASALEVKCALLMSFALGSLALAEAPPLPAAVSQEAAAGTQIAAQRVPQTKEVEAVLARRMRLLARELDLDPAQQESVRRILEDQQAAVRAVLADPRLAPAERGPAIGDIQERTANQIRSVLNDEQRQKYHKARPSSRGAEHPDIQTWLDVASGKRAAPGPAMPRRLGADG